MSFALIFIGGLLFVGFAIFAFISRAEGEQRAAVISLGLAGLGAMFCITAVLPLLLKLVLLGLGGSLMLIFLILSFWPLKRLTMGDDTPKARYDEREIVFARARLVPGSPEYTAYYQMHPEHEAIDQRTRSKPGLLSPKAKLANPFLFASPQASFGLTEALREAVDGPVGDQRQSLPVEDLTAYLKNLALYYGACAVGVTELMPYHVYSHIGRGSGVYGASIPLEHRFALAFTVEMDYQMLRPSPQPQVVMESAKQYVEAARIAVQLAGAIRALGYAARAHIDGNYRVIAPLVARDAGLGEIGRMGILMTPKQGPRVRLGVVTTQAALLADQRQPDPAMIDFCRACTKCATNCPSQSIPYGDRLDIEGTSRWKIEAETCFHYWNVTGTDCARCMRVCPYAHPDSTAHNLVRWGISQSAFFRRLAIWADDIFYGKKPASRPAPEWTRVS